MRQQPHSSQSGVVLIISLIVLVAMTLAALALIRSVDTNTLIAGNLSFQQAASHAADKGVEAAVDWLNSSDADELTLQSDLPDQGYVANGSDPLLSPNSVDDKMSWDNYWNRYVTDTSKRGIVTLPADVSGNTVSYIIDRLCNSAGTKSKTNCVLSPVTAAGTGNSNAAGSPQFNALMSVYYRITVRVDGPRNTVSYVQSVVYK